MTSPQRRICASILSSCLGGKALLGAFSFSVLAAAPVLAQADGLMQLQARRSAEGLEIVVVGVGAQPVLQQRVESGQWQGRLTTKGTPGVRGGVSRLSLPDLGIQRFSLEGNGSTYLLRFDAVDGVTPPDPLVSADGRNLILSFPGLASPTLQTGRLDLNTPGRVPQARYAPPLRPRAVAPPLGDMAVGTMVLQNRSFVNVSGPPVTLTLNNAPAKDALLSIARLGGYGFVFVGEDLPGTTTTPGVPGTTPPSGQGLGGLKPVTMSFQNESYARALNGILLASGLQGKLDGRTLLVGTSVSAKTFGPQVSKVYRLNQASATSAADYLASLGASMSKVNTTSIITGEPASVGTSQLSTQTSQTRSTLTNVETYGSSVGPLRGLTGTTDARLQTVTLVGDSQLVAIAESYLKQIDLRQRQVALTVKILDINLENDKQIANSFAFRSGNMFVVSNNGELLANFGSYKPPGSEAGGLPGQYSAQDGTTPVPGTGILSGDNTPFFDRPNSPYPLPGSSSQLGGTTLSPTRPDFGTYNNPLQPGVSDVTEDGIEYTAPAKFQYPTNQFFDFLRAKIESSSTKVLASPTLVLQEGGEKSMGTDSGKISEDGKIGREYSNEAYVRVGTQFVTSYDVKQDVNGNNFCQPVFANAGLTFGARVDKIDDNGFITFALSPEISAPVGSEQVGNCGSITLINDRSLDTGKIRVRDGQTLILTGVINDTDREVVSKWPILGDLPFVGQFFRSSGGQRSKSELVILVTPRIIDDRSGGSYGYGYRPNLPAARQIMTGT